MWFYGCFRYKSKPTIAIAMIMAITPAAMYVNRSEVVATFAIGADVGAGVAACCITSNEVCAYDWPVTVCAVESSDNCVAAWNVRCPC